MNHTGPLNTCLDCNLRYEFTNQSSILSLADLSFDLSVYDIFGTLAAGNPTSTCSHHLCYLPSDDTDKMNCHLCSPCMAVLYWHINIAACNIELAVGGSLVVPLQSAILEPSTLVSYIAAHSITHWNSVPQLAEMLCDYLTHNCQCAASCESLEFILMSGDAIPRSLPSRLYTLLPKCQQVSMGGATEGSIWSIIYDIGDPATLPDWPTIPYGHAMYNQRMYVLDNQLDHCPWWATGEIAIGGVGVALGYWNAKDQTDAQFKMRNGEPVYLTGNLLVVVDWH